MVVVEGFAFVDEFDAARVFAFGFARGEAADFVDFEVAFGDGEGGEVEGVGGTFVAEDEDIGGELGLDAAGAVGGAIAGEAIVVVAVVVAGRGVVGVRVVVDYVMVVIFCDAGGRDAGVGEGGVAPSAGPVAAAHKEEEGEEWEECCCEGC